MRGEPSGRRLAALAAVGILAVRATGCGRLTIRTWIKVIEAESSNFGFGADVTVDPSS